METLYLIPPMGHSPHFYNVFIDELKDNFKVIVLSYPNQGSDNPEKVLDELTDIFATIISRDPQERVLLGGLSLGATICLNIKKKIPKKISHLFLIASGGLKVARARKDMVTYVLENAGRKEFINRALNLTDKDIFLTHFSQNHLSAELYFKHLTDVYWSDKGYEDRSQFLVAQTLAALNVNYEDLLSQFQEEITFIWGEKDKIFSMRHYKKFQKLIPRSKCILFSDDGHYIPLESPKKLAKILIDHEKT